MKFLVCSRLSEHRYKTPEGYLVCVDSILSRTGKQTYSRDELFKDGCNDEVEVERSAEEVFSEKTLASFENKPLTIEHPEEDVTPANHNKYSVGFIRDIKRGKDGSEDVMLGTIVVTDAEAIELIEAGKLKELSCGYDCDIEDEDNPQQRNIRGNHVALCEKGRAGIARIVDSIKDAVIKTISLRGSIQRGDIGKIQFNLIKENSCWISIEGLYQDDKSGLVNIRGRSECVLVKKNGGLTVNVQYVVEKPQSRAFEKVEHRLETSVDFWKDDVIDFVEKTYDRVLNSVKAKDSVKDATFEVWYVDKHDNKQQTFVIATDQKEARQKVQKIYGPYRIYEVRKVKDGVKDMKVSHDNIREQPIYVMQSNVDKNLFFYIGKTHAMKEGEFTYAQYDMEGMTPDELRKELEANGWHKVARGPAPFIDEDPYEESTKGLEEAEKNLHDEMICNTETDCRDALQTFRIGFDLNVPVTLDVKATDVKSAIEKAKQWAKTHNYDDTSLFREVKTKGDRHFQIDACKDAKTEYVFNYRDTYHGTRDKMRVDANNLDEAIRKFGATMALGGFGTANIYVVSVSPNDGYMRAYGKLSEMLKQKWTRDSVKKLDSKKLFSIVRAAKSIKSKDAKETKLAFVPTNDFANIDMTNAMIGKLASSGIDYHSARKNAGKYSVVILGGDDVVRKAKSVIENIGFFSKWS